MTRKEITIRFLLNALKQTTGAYGYDFWLSNNIEEHALLWNCAIEVLKSEPPPPYAPPTSGMVHHMVGGTQTRESKTAEEIYPFVADIFWLLCVQGILRPGIRQARGQSVNSGTGYSLTLRGRAWVQNYSENDLQGLLDAL